MQPDVKLIPKKSMGYKYSTVTENYQAANTGFI